MPNGSGVNPIDNLVPQGGALSVEQVQRVLIQPLQQASVFLSSGVKLIDSSNPVRLPIAPPVDEALPWVSEGGTIPLARELLHVAGGPSCLCW